MRVLIPNHFPLEGSGSGIYTQNVARELMNKGHEAYTITPAHQEQTGFPFQVHTILFTPSGSPSEGEGRLPFNFPCFTTHPLSNTTYGDLEDSQRDAYIEVFVEAVSAITHSWQPDIIHAQHLWVTPYAALQTGLPYVATAHGTDLMGFRKYPEWVAVAREGTQHAQTVIAISRQVEDDAISLYGLSKDRVRRVLNGFNQEIFRVMDLDRSEVLADYGITPAPEVLISFVGKLTEFKGVDVLLEAAAIYEPELGSTATLIIGDGELRESLKTQAVELGLQGVHFLGHRPQPEVARILNVADLSIVPSRVEPFGLVAVEALACGTPVVATDEGGLPDFIDSCVGALVPVDDPTALAQAIIGEIRTSAKEEKGGFAGAYALEHFSWSGQVDRMIDIYEEAVATQNQTHRI